MQGHDSGYYTQAEVNDFLSDMQAQFDSMVSELRDRVEELAAAIESMKPRVYRYAVSQGSMYGNTGQQIFNFTQDAHLTED